MIIEHGFKPKFGAYQNESPSLVSFILAAEGRNTSLTVLHRNFQPDSQVYAACATGWSKILQGLKTWLEGCREAE